MCTNYFSTTGIHARRALLVLFLIILLSLVPLYYAISKHEDNIDKRILSLDTHIKKAVLPPKNDAPEKWETNREYGIVIDAGSSGSRVLVYSWKNTACYANYSSLPVIQTADQEGKEWNYKEKPGISTFASKPNEVSSHLIPLLEYAKGVIPANKHSSTPLYLLATAGMRLVPKNEQIVLFENICKFVSNAEQYAFSIDGGCDYHFRIISGELEGIYGWTAVNYLMGGFKNTYKPNKPINRVDTFGFLDMGGASTQMAFEPTPEMSSIHSDDLTKIKLRTLDGQDLDYNIFVTTFLGFGVNEARRRYLELLTEKTGDSQTSIDDPCSPPGLVFDTVPSISGSGDLDLCLKKMYPLLNKTLPCSDTPCLFNGVHAPIKDFLKHRFLGISEYWYTLQDMFKLGGVYSYEKLSTATKEYCKSEWSELTVKFKDVLSEEGIERLELQCFKSAWIMNILHYGFGIPFSISGDDEGGDFSSATIPTSPFRSINEVGEFSVSWTLGAILFHVSETIPQKGKYPTLSLNHTIFMISICLLIVGAYTCSRQGPVKTMASEDILMGDMETGGPLLEEYLTQPIVTNATSSSKSSPISKLMVSEMKRSGSQISRASSLKDLKYRD